MKLFITLLSVVIIPVYIYSQDASLSKKELKKQKVLTIDTLSQKLNGVKYADLGLSKAQEQIIINSSSSVDVQILLGIRDYLKKDLGVEIIITQEQRIEALKKSKSQCDYVGFSYDVGSFKSGLGAIGSYPFSFSFSFCDKSIYSFETKMSVSGLTNYAKTTREVCKFNFFYERKFDSIKKMKVGNNKNIINLSTFTNYLDTVKQKNRVEGIYQLFSSDNNTSNYKIGIYKLKDTLSVVYFEGADFEDDWFDGELKGMIQTTKSENDFLAQLYTLNKTLVEGSISFLNDNSFEMRMKIPGFGNGVDKFVRIK